MAGVVAVIALIVAVGAAIYASNMAPDDNGGRQLTKQGSQNSRDRVYGTCRVTCTNVFTNVLNRDQSYRMDVFAAAGIGPLRFHNIWIEDKQMFDTDKDELTTATSSTSGLYDDSSMRSSYQKSKDFKMQWRSGQENQVAASLATSYSDNMFTSSCKGAFVPTIVIYADFSDDQEYVIFGDRYQIEALVTAVDIYDPRTGATDGASSNPALAIYDFLTSTYFGMGIATDYIDTDSIKNAANFCDTNELEIHTQIDGSASFSDTLTAMLATFGGALVIQNGLIKILVEEKELVTQYSFNEDNILENSFQVKPDSSSNYYNVVSATYKASDKSDKLDDYVVPPDAVDQLADTSTRIGKDGEIITKKLNLNFCREYYYTSKTVKFLTNREYIRSDYQTTCNFDIDLEDYPDLGIWSVIDITHSVYGWNAKKMRVISMETSTESERFNIATIHCSEYNDAIYEGDIDGVGGDAYPDWDQPVSEPSDLTFELQSVVTDGYGVLSWTANHFNSGVTYDIEWKLSSEEQWTRLASSHKTVTYDVYNLKVDFYDFRVRAVDLLLGVSDWTEITNEDVGVGYSLPTVANLGVNVGTLDFEFYWDSVLDETITNAPEDASPTSGNSTGTVADVFQHYEVTIKQGETAQKVYHVTDPTFTYTYEENNTSTSGLGRAITAEVKVVDKLGNKSDTAATLTGTNAQVSAPTGFDTTNTLQTSNLKWNLPADIDYAATEVHVSTTSGFTPSSSTLVSTTTSNNYLYQFPDGTDSMFARIGHYDKFGSDSINYSGEITLIYIPIDVEYDDAELADALQILQDNINDLNTELNNKFPVETEDLADLAVTTAKLVDDAITESKIAADSITAALISDDAVTAAALADGAVTTTTIADDAITTPKIVAGAVVSDSIASSAILSDKIAANAIVSGKIASQAIVADNIVSGTITSLEIASQAITADELAANAVTADKILANAVTTEKIYAAAITGEKIASNTVSTENLYVGAISHVNNFSTSEIADGWTGGWPLATTESLYGKTVTTMKVETDGNAMVISDAFQVDHDEIYEVNLTIYNAHTDGTTGTKYFGMYAFGDSIYDGVDPENDTKLAVEIYDADTLTQGSDTANPYFWSGDVGSGDWMIFKAYIVGANADVNAISETNNVDYIVKLNADVKSASLRFLSYDNSGTSTETHFYNPSVKRVGAGFIRTENIKAGVIEGYSIKSNSLIESPKIHVGDVEGLTGKSVAIDSLADSPIIIRNGTDTMLKFVTVSDSDGTREVLQLGGGLAAGTISSADVFSQALWDIIAPEIPEATGGIYQYPTLPVDVSSTGTTNLSQLQIASANGNDVEISFSFSYGDLYASTFSDATSWRFKIARSVNGGTATTIYDETFTGDRWFDGEMNKYTYSLDVSATVTDSSHGAVDEDTIEYFLTTIYVSGHNSTTNTRSYGPSVNSFTVAQASGGSGGVTTIVGLTDVEIGTLEDGDSLIYDADSARWVNGPGGGAISTLSDVELSAVNDGQILSYDSGSTSWKNIDIPATLENVVDADDGASVTGNLTATGNITAGGGVWGYSDIRLKENILPLDNALERVCLLNGVSFDRKDINASMAGLIAQDVERAIPCGVSNDLEYKRIDLNAVVGLLVESVKDLKARIEELESERS